MKQAFDDLFRSLSTTQQHIVFWSALFIMMAVMACIALGFIGEFLKSLRAWCEYKDRKRNEVKDAG